MRRALLTLFAAAVPAVAQAQFVAQSQTYYGCWRFGCTTAVAQMTWNSVDEWKAGLNGGLYVTFVDDFHPFGGESAATVHRFPGLDGDADPEAVFDTGLWGNSRCWWSVGLATGPTTCDELFTSMTSPAYHLLSGLSFYAVVGPSGSDIDVSAVLGATDDAPPPFPPGQYLEFVGLAAVPEPGSLALLGTGLAALAAAARRRQRRRMA